MAIDVRIRRISTGDTALCGQLNTLFATAFEDSEHYLSARPEASYFAEILEKPHIIALVATVRGAAIGGLVAYELDKLEQQRSEIYIYDLAVDARFRRQGIATQLIDLIRKIARERHAYVVYVQADHEDGPAVALYTKLGKREDVMHFDIEP